MTIPDLLKTCPLFLELYDKEIESLVKACRVFTYERGASIIKAGHEGKEIFVILEGTVSIHKRTDQGELIRVQDLKKGHLLGEAALLEERVYQSDITAKTTVSMLEIPYDEIFKRFKTEPRVFAIIMLNLSRMLARRLRT